MGQYADMCADFAHLCAKMESEGGNPCIWVGITYMSRVARIFKDRLFPWGMLPLRQELCVFLIINESVVTRGRRISITLCIHVWSFKIEQLHIS